MPNFLPLQKTRSSIGWAGRSRRAIDSVEEDILGAIRKSPARIKALRADLMSAQAERAGRRRRASCGASFTPAQKRELRRWFDELDFDGSGEINAEELEDALLSTGMARTREDVIRILRTVDHDQSGTISFHEFLSVLKGNDKICTPPIERKKDSHRLPREVNPIVKLQDMKQKSELSLRTLICRQRRMLLMKEIMHDNVKNMKLLSSTEAAYDNACLNRDRGRNIDANELDEMRSLIAAQVEQKNKKEEYLLAMKRAVLNAQGDIIAHSSGVF